jgi:hypothetical protein
MRMLTEYRFLMTALIILGLAAAVLLPVTALFLYVEYDGTWPHSTARPVNILNDPEYDGELAQ